ncbi:MAG: short-chain dehydrogenase [Methylibium sp. NZG]|nr:MAG: short-chain dehydrogenase [Methylibium sp. NZG]
MGIAVVTGASRGIGLEIALQLCRRGQRVVAVCRSRSPALEASAARIESGIDLIAAQAGPQLAALFKHDDIDLLIHNAGVLHEDRVDQVDPNAVRAQFELNALAPLRLTAALAPRLARGAKLALISSRMGSMGDNTSGGYYGYRMSKAALNAAGVSLAHDLRPRGVAVVILHPGAVRTDMTGGHGLLGAEESVRGLLERIDELSLETTGRFVHQNGSELPW